ncbi:hypothetical protein CCR85_04225 [Rhodothalassium salexigens]|uniref:poly-gamma-glutamate system protein n=1 Tax=Rhodothalassium salexigens TaxID=1086 RepID=UPI0019131895|nr:poly-gamma-glutamate system protein [Rhodothalassium salexigens]MBK5910698.1 hypothetical protein [Rhodothalassium salexigens]MBK5921672.1 hypothetical protein [Rhodothalassium salexigens]
MIKRGQQLYWRPSRVPIPVMVALAVVSILCVTAVETFKGQDDVADYYDVMLKASRQAEQGMEYLRPLRGRVEPIDPSVDPRRTGMVGVASSRVTSNSGHLPAKLTSVNPNWAAVAVKLLVKAGVREGDVVAVAVSGSFPAINLAVYSALEALGAEPVVIASASASQWGANVPGFVWLDMARELRDGGIIKTKARAATLGAREDIGGGLSQTGIASLKGSLSKAEVPLLDVSGYRQSVARRIALYREEADGRPIKAMVNVGGGIATTGPPGIDGLFETGLSYAAPKRAFAAPSVLGYFLDEGVPVIHFSGIAGLAARHGLPEVMAEDPAIGEGGVYTARQYRRWLAGTLILVLLGVTTLAMRSANLALNVDQPGEKPKGLLRPKV